MQNPQSEKVQVSANWKTLSKQLGLNVVKTKKLVKNHRHTQQDLSPLPKTFYTDLPTQISSLFPQIDPSKAELVGKYVGLDCEFVGIGHQGQDHALARVSIVNFHGKILLDSYVKPKEKIIDFRTAISGITFEHIKNAPSLAEVQEKVCEIIQGRIVVGHDLKHDFKALVLNHLRRDLRDTAVYAKFRSLVQGKAPSLKMLADQYFGLEEFQKTVHSSVQDAQVAMLIYRKFRDEWEASFSKKKGSSVLKEQEDN